MTTINSIRWCLTYGDGKQIIEPLDGWSIRNARKWPSKLSCISDDGYGHVSIVCEILLTKQEPVPIFYRERSITLDGSGKTNLDAIVFGRASGKDDPGACTMWTINKQGLQPCNPTAIDMSALNAIVLDLS
jgi:hypothetical protein